MKTILFVLVTVLTTGVYANFPIFEITDFEGTYQDGAGEARASKFQVKEFDFGDSPKFNIEKQGSSLYFSTPRGEFSLDNIPLVSDSVSGLRWSRINASSDGDKIKVAIGQLVAQVSQNVINVKHFVMDCKNSGSKVKDAFLDSCFNKEGRIAFEKIKTTSRSTTTSIKDFGINMRNGRFSFKLTSSATVKGSGEVSYKNQKLVLKITSAKSSGFNIIKRFFRELKKAESGNIKVSRPYITISI